MNRPITITIFMLALLVAGIFHVAHGAHEKGLVLEQQKAIEYQAMVKRECKLRFPIPGKSRDKCVEKGLHVERKRMVASEH